MRKAQGPSLPRVMRGTPRPDWMMAMISRLVESFPSEFTRFRIVFPAPSFGSDAETVLDQTA